MIFKVNHLDHFYLDFYLAHHYYQNQDFKSIF